MSRALNAPAELSPDSYEQVATALLREYFGAENTHAVVVLTEEKGALIIGLDCAYPNRTAHWIFRRLRDSAKYQLSGRRPSLLCVMLSGVSTLELNTLYKDLNGRTELERGVIDLFKRRPALSAVEFVGFDGILRRKATSDLLLEQFVIGRSSVIFPNHLAKMPLLR